MSSPPEDGEEVDDGDDAGSHVVAIHNDISGFVHGEGQKSSSVNPTLLERQSALLASLVHATGDKRLSQSTERVKFLRRCSA